MKRLATALVLAGGRSERFGSDKALAQFRGAPLALHVLRGLAALGFDQLLLAAKDTARYAPLADETTHTTGAAVELIADEASFQTPLAGLAAGLARARNELVFACAADMPFVADAALLDALTAAIAGHDAAVPTAGGSLQPLAALWRRSAVLPLAVELLAGPRPVGPRALLPRLRTAQLDWGDIRPFLDADTPEALRDLQATNPDR